MIVVKRVFIAIILCLFAILIITYTKINLTKIDNISIEKKIKNVEKDNEKIDEDIHKTEENITSLKKEKEDKWQELNTWQKTKEKIEAALQK